MGKYEIGRLLGEGSFGLVYEARPVGSDGRVALKQVTKLGVRREEILRGTQGLATLCFPFAMLPLLLFTYLVVAVGYAERAHLRAVACGLSFGDRY